MLFGHQNDDTTQPDATPVMQGSGLNPLAVDPATGASLPVAPAEPVDQADSSAEASVLNQPSSSGSTATAPTVDASAPDVVAPDSASAEPQVVSDSPVASDAPSVSTPAADDNAAPANDDLLSLKQQALTQLSPLVSQLDQTPEEKFRTTMMMIQSTDNQALIKDAYDAAQQIPEEKTRAQALLDVVNEINYFTQQK